MTLEEMRNRTRIVSSRSTKQADLFFCHLARYLEKQETVIDFLECGHKGCEAILVASDQRMILIWQDGTMGDILSELIQYQDILVAEHESFLWQKDLRITTQGKSYYLLDISETGSGTVVNYIARRLGGKNIAPEKDGNLLSAIFENMDRALSEATSELGKEIHDQDKGSRGGYSKAVINQRNPIEKFFYGLAEIQSFNSREIGKLIEEFPSLVREDEVPKHGAKGRYKDTYKGLLVATTQRVMVLYLGNENLTVLDTFDYSIDHFVDVDSDAILGGTIEFCKDGYFSFDHPETGQYYKFYQYVIEKVHGKSKGEESEKVDLQPKVIPLEIKEKPIPAFRGTASIEKMRQLNIAIEDQTISDYLDEMELICGEIFSYVEKYPEKESEIRNFLDHYLPQTFSLLEKYDDLSEKTMKTENIRQAMNQITEVLAVIVEAFKNLYNQFYENEAMQISVEVQVLKNVLAQHGLTSESSPFEVKK